MHFDLRVRVGVGLICLAPPHTKATFFKYSELLVFKPDREVVNPETMRPGSMVHVGAQGVVEGAQCRIVKVTKKIP